MRLFILLWLLTVFYFEANAISEEAEKKRVPVKTNINKVSGEFDLVPNRSELEGSVASYRGTGTTNFNNAKVREILNPTDNPEGLRDVDPHSMESMGRVKRSELTLFNDFETDYTKPGAAKHKADIKRIISATEDKIGKLSEALKKHGIDCKEEPLTKEPSSEYYIEIEKEKHKEVTYNQHFCEQPVNIYNCHDAMTIRCEQKGMLWKEWQDPIHLKIPGRELMNSGFPVFYGDHVAKNIFEFKIFSSNSGGRFRIPFNSVPGMKGFLAKRHDFKHPDHISDDMHLSWEGGVSGVSGEEYMGRRLGGKDHVWNIYNVTYRIRDGDEICEKWSDEIWDESCNISTR